MPSLLPVLAALTGALSMRLTPCTFASADSAGIGRSFMFLSHPIVQRFTLHSGFAFSCRGHLV